MYARAVIALAALVAAHAQVEVDVYSNPDDVEKRYTPELVSELQTAKDDALLLYTEFSARAGAELKSFTKNISGLANETISKIDPWLLQNAPEKCKAAFDKRIKKVEYDVHRLAGFSAESHHKFFLGHMIVFRIHLNKSEDYINRCDRVIKSCGNACETTPRVVRWRRLAKQEINRVKDDLQHSRLSYHDLLSHSHKRLLHLRKQATTRAQIEIDKFQTCVHSG